MYVHARVYECKNTRKKFFEKSCGNIWPFGYNVVTLHRQTKPNNLKLKNMATKKNRANSAKANAAKQVKSNEATAAAAVIEDVAVETIETQEATAAAVVPIATETESEKVSSKEVLKAAGSLRAAVKEERRGANCTIRLIAERAASGDAAAVDVLCALCDVPRAALYSLNIDTIRAAVNAYYPYFVEVDGRKVSVKPAGVWYSTAAKEEAIEDAAKRVQRGYMAVHVADYLDQIIKAAKCRAKGVKPRRVDAEAIYSNIELSEAAVGITTKDIDDAKARRAYSPNGVNVWHKDRTGFYI